MLKQIMKRAVELARTFEGAWTARMSLALRQAWAEARAPKTVVVELRAPNRKNKTWVAAITGPHPTYKLDRKFVNADRYGEYDWTLAEGVYEVCENGNRFFIRVAAGDWSRVEYSDVVGYVASVA